MLKQYTKEFWSLFFIATILMIGLAYYQNTVVLYLLKQFHFSANNAYEINGVFSAGVYLCPIASGWLTKKWLQPSTSITLGLLLFALGAFLSIIANSTTYLLGLAFSALGYGLIYINTFFLIGQLYQLDDPRREGSFTLAYIALNVGSLIGFAYGGHALASAHIHVVVFVFGLFFLCMAILSGFLMKLYLTPQTIKKENWLAIAFLSSLIVLTMLIALLIADHIQTLLSIICFMLLLSIFYIGIKEYRHDRIAGRKIILLGTLTVIAVIFWTFYKMQDSFILVFIQQHSLLNIGNIDIPAPTLLSINPIVILLIGPLVSLFWLKTKTKYNSPVTKVALGLLIMGIAFTLLCLGILSHFPIYLLWVILFFSIVAIAEIIFGPGTVSMVGQLSNEKYHLILLGLTQLSMSSASIFSAQISVLFQNSLPHYHLIQIAYNYVYRDIALILIGSRILIFLYKRFFLK